MSVYTRVGFHATICTAIVVAVPVATWVLDIDPRLMGMITGAVGLCLLLFQLIDSWHLTTLLAKVLVIALIISLLLSVIAQWQLRHNVVLVTVVTYPLIAHRMGCVLIGLYWRWLLRFDSAANKHRLVAEDSDPT